MKSGGKRGWLARGLEATGMNRLLPHLPGWRGLLVFNYHRIGCARDALFDRALWSAAAETFDTQVAWLQRQCDVVGLDDLDDVFSRRTGRCAMITFDDGYRDNYETAFPILRSRGAPAAFFIATGFLDRPRVPWWDEIAWMVRSSKKDGLEADGWLDGRLPFDEPDRNSAVHRLLRIYKQTEGGRAAAFLDHLADATGSGRCSDEQAAELWMTWDMVREMRRGGMSFGGHTVNHPVLARLSEDEQSAEIEGCRQRLQEELGEPIVDFSYPVGGANAFNETTRRLLESHGYTRAFSYYGGYTRFDRHNAYDPFDIPRVAVETDVSVPEFRATTALPQVFASRR